MKKLGIAIVGCGMIAESHALAIAGDGRCELAAAAYGTNLERGEAFASRFGAPVIAGDYRELFSKNGIRNKIDVVCVCTPSGLHAGCAVDFMDAGVHALVEKPLDITSEAITKMIEASERNGTRLGCVFPNRTRPGLIRAAELIASGSLGGVRVVECQYRGYRSPAYYRSSKWKGTKRLDGGGCLMNQGIHAIDAMIWLAGEVESVCGQIGALGRDIEVEDAAAALLRFKSGAQGVLMGTTLSHVPEDGPEGDRIRVECERGSIVYADGGATYYKNGSADDFDVTAVPLGGDDGETVSSGAAPANIDMRAHQIIFSDFISAVLEGREPLAPARSARRAVDTVLAIYRSAESGRWENVEPR